MFWENFYKLCQQNNISANAVCAQLGLSTAAATHWKSGTMPKGDILLKISKYFGVTTDYLLTGNETKNQPENELTADELELLDTYRQLSQKGKTMSRAYMYSYLDSDDYRTAQIAADTGEQYDDAPEPGLKKQIGAVKKYLDS